ncbi:MAG: hypothetical protein FJW69_04470 [Actinobacteria bacterium]|nr:hypothetical protein [Actinomycetota bacterium]MBM3713932.1 hypothetical protein [Actinomycetota bacterium]
MKKNTALLNDDVKEIILSDEYWRMLGSIGFSKDFISNERIRKQKECIEYLLKLTCKLPGMN